ncbi:FG-GAP-like repeat-containing protein [Winogradskyella sp. 3972H.M.0a.05]|uniref:T9SS type A sorting domain-containing protein n=1 Tax=Winogradskyella sp. 3972H.M.0a.05 TaxID=2950277 RepID=UPI003397A45A
MKKNYLLVLALLFFSTTFAQISFQEDIIIGRSNFIYQARLIHSADIDGDGDMDVISTSYTTDIIGWQENLDGQGTFSIMKNISTSVNGPHSVFTADLDSDGDLDVLSASGIDGKIAWYENLDGQGNFGGQQVLVTVQGTRNVFADDLDNDGDMDVLMTSLGQNIVAWFENTDGQGTFSSILTIDNNFVDANDVKTADVDGDGDIDVLSSSYNGCNIVWYENTDGLGNFGPQQQFISNHTIGARYIYTVDIDGDNDMDVLSASSNYNRITWFENTNGLGSFGTEQLIANNVVGVNSIYAADFDNDGDMDVLSSSYTDDKIAWYENTNGLGDFGTQQTISTTADTAISAIAADIDNDGYMDVVSSMEHLAEVSWYKNNDGSGEFDDKKVVSISTRDVNSIDIADLDGDGDMDIISASNNFGSDDRGRIIWFENIQDQQCNFCLPHIVNDIDEAYSISAVDIDGDGDMDLLSAVSIENNNTDDRIVWYENVNGVGDFSSPIIIDTVEHISAVVAADVDGDDDMDLLMTTAEDDQLVWYENVDGEGTYSPKQLIAGNLVLSISIDVSDIDGDGDNDVLVSDFFNDNIKWFKNMDGLGNFSNGFFITNADLNSPQWVQAGDMDTDGDLDILVADSFGDAQVSWFENIDGMGTFGEKQVVAENVDSAEKVYAADLDNDGDKDIISISNKVIWFENLDGQGNFGTQQVIRVGSEVFNDLKIADINNDGDIDIFSSSSIADEIAWYKNLGVLGNEITGTIRIDSNSDGCTNTDIAASNIMVVADNGADSFSTFTLQNGNYQLPVNEGNFVVSISNLPNYYQPSPESYSADFFGLGNTNVADFCLEPSIEINDLNVSVYPINEARPGFDANYQLVYRNVGTVQLSGNVSFEFDENKLQFLNADETVSSQTSNTITFDYEDLHPFEVRTINLYFNVYPPPTTNIDDILNFSATINPVTGDETEVDNTFEFQQVVIGSYDPNDIQVLEGEEIILEEANEYLHYIIRFQNTGTASAINVRVENVLDDKLDWTTMQLESLSHDGRVEIENGNQVEFIFNNIYLPDSTNDEPNSHGYIAYKIKPKDNVVVGNIFYNTADIYFDFNPPITTNTVATEIVDVLGIGEFESNIFSVYPNPTDSELTISGNVIISELKIIDINGRVLKTIENITDNTIKLDVSYLQDGMYFLNIEAGNYQQNVKFLKD